MWGRACARVCVHSGERAPDIHSFLRQLTLVFEVKARRHHADVALEVQQELVGCGVEEGWSRGPCDRWQEHTVVQVDGRNLLSEACRGDISLSLIHGALKQSKRDANVNTKTLELFRFEKCKLCRMSYFTYS